MNRKTTLATLAILSVAAVNSYAAPSDPNDALSIMRAKIGMTQAVAAAEEHAGGKAARAEFERHNGQWVFDVEVVKGNQVMDVKVDPTTGRILSAATDKADRDGEHDRED